MFKDFMELDWQCKAFVLACAIGVLAISYHGLGFVFWLGGWWVK